MFRSKSLLLLNCVLTVLLTSSCTNSTKEIEIKQSQVVVEQIKHPRPQAVTPVKIKIVVITPETIKKLNNQKGAEPYVYFCYSTEDYLTFSQWLNDVLRYVNQLKAVISSYELSVDTNNKNLKK